MTIQDIGDETKRRILTCAHKLFYKKGFSKTTIDDIAQASGTSHALIHYHFKTKGGLMHAVGVDVTEKQLRVIDEIFSQETPFVRSLIATFLFWRFAVEDVQFLDFCTSIFDVTLEENPASYSSFFLAPYEAISETRATGDIHEFTEAAARGIDHSILKLIKDRDTSFDAEEVAFFTIQTNVKFFNLGDCTREINRARKLAKDSTIVVKEGIFWAATR